MFIAYKRICDRKLLEPGKLWLWRGADCWILNFPTKIHWRKPSKIEWIRAGLQKFVEKYEILGIREISFPRLGCGNGGLEWDEVRPIMEQFLSPLPIQVFVHDYTVEIGLPEHLEDVARRLRSEQSADTTFEAFLNSLRRAVHLIGQDLVDLGTKEPMSATFDSESLSVFFGEQSWSFGTEDLWGVWVSLQNGLLTIDKAGWSTSGGGKPLLSILSLLPQIRPVEIQRATDSVPELAVELRECGRGSVPVPENPTGQLVLAWH